jgi:hypothetical protein
MVVGVGFCLDRATPQILRAGASSEKGRSLSLCLCIFAAHPPDRPPLLPLSSFSSLFATSTAVSALTVSQHVITSKSLCRGLLNLPFWMLDFESVADRSMIIRPLRSHGLLSLRRDSPERSMVVRSSARCQGIRRPSGLSAQTMSKMISSRMHKVVTASSHRMHSDLDPSLTSTTTSCIWKRKEGRMLQLQQAVWRHHMQRANRRLVPRDLDRRHCITRCKLHGLKHAGLAEGLAEPIAVQPPIGGCCASAGDDNIGYDRQRGRCVVGSWASPTAARRIIPP